MTQTQIRELIDYNEKTGIMTWRKGSTKKGKNRDGNQVGSITARGYLETKIRGQRMLVHQAIFLWMTGYVPKGIDHEDRIKSNNIWKNLRDISQAENMKNKNIPTNNTSGYIGVSYIPSRKKWGASIGYKNKTISLGNHTKLADALKAREDAEIKYGYHPKHGK